jgi:hypothetical protein
LISFGFHVFSGLGLGGFYGVPLVSLGFLFFLCFGRNKGTENPRKRHTQGKSEAISPYDASIMPVRLLEQKIIEIDVPKW